MNVLIVEDEYSAAENLQYLIRKNFSNLNVVKVTESVTETIDFLSDGPTISLAFFDIHLGDGLSFEIFQRCRFEAPIIFTTAYDTYAIKAFEVNSIDYLLKPIREEDLIRGVQKFHSLKPQRTEAIDYTSLFNSFGFNSIKYLSTILIRKKDTILPVRVEDIAYFGIVFGLVKAFCHTGTTYTIDENLDELESRLDPSQFFRANRQFIVHKRSIVSLNVYFNGKLLLETKPKHSEQIVISKIKAPQIKDWLIS